MSEQYVSNFTYINHSKRNSVFVIVIYILLIAVIFGAIGTLLELYGPSYDFPVVQSSGYTGWEWLFPVLVWACIGILVALGVCAYTYSESGKILAKAANAHTVSRQEEPFLFETVDAIAGGVELKTPEVYVIETPELNAFASGSRRGKSMLAVTRGMLEAMNREELEGVVAHEIAHLKNDDIKFVSLAVALSATLLLITRSVSHGFFRSGGRRSDRSSGGGAAMVVLLIIAVVIVAITPILARALQGAVSRQREFLADASGAAIIGYPLGLASALEKIAAANSSYLENHKSSFTNSSVHALCISDPVSKRVSGLFATHPPIEERIRRLRGSR